MKFGIKLVTFFEPNIALKGREKLAEFPFHAANPKRERSSKTYNVATTSEKSLT